MPDESAYGPHQLRLISRYEAASMLRCSLQTITNWVQKGILRSRKINNMVLIDKASIEHLFDTASEVAEMEKKLRVRRKELREEIENIERKLASLREELKNLDYLDYFELREENQRLLKENRELAEEVERRIDVKGVFPAPRDISSTPFAREISTLGFSTRVVNGLLEVGCSTLADLVTINPLTIMKSRRIGW